MTRRRREQSGITLMEMLIVVAIIGLMIAVAFPSIASLLDTLRLRSATDEIAAHWNAALNRADRRQMAVEVLVQPATNRIFFASADNSYRRELEMPQGVTIRRVLPLLPNVDDNAARQFLVHPGGTVPRIGIEIQNRRNVRRLVLVDPITGVPQVIENPQ